MSAKARLRDVSSLTPEEVALLQEAQQRALAHRGASPAPVSLVRLLPPAAAPRGEPSAPRTWVCARCSQPYQAPRCLDRCAACQRAELEVARRARRLQLRDQALAPAGEDFQYITLDHPRLGAWVRSPRALAKARERAALNYDEDRGEWPFLLLLGGTGAGKTTLGTAVFRHLADRVLAPGATEADEEFVRGMVWMPGVELARARRETPLGKPITKVERALNATVLMLDDLGQEAPCDKDDLVYVLTERQRHRRPTLVTYGFSLGSLAERYGAHLERRLTERAHLLDLGDPKGKGRGKSATPEEAPPAGGAR
jgi:DNA replication protein DnaC